MPAPVPDKVMRLAARHHVSGRLREAAALYRRALQDDPRNAEALHALGVMAWQTGRPDAAEKLLARAVEADPSSAEANDDLGCLHFIAGRTEQAMAAFAAAAAADPGHVAAHAHLGAALARLGRFEAAVAAYQRAVDAGLVNRRRRGVAIDIGPFAVAAVEPEVLPPLAAEAEPPPPPAPDAEATITHSSPAAEPFVTTACVTTAYAGDPMGGAAVVADPPSVPTDASAVVPPVPEVAGPVEASPDAGPFADPVAEAIPEPVAAAPVSEVAAAAPAAHVFASEPIWANTDPAVMVFSAADASSGRGRHGVTVEVVGPVGLMGPGEAAVRHLPAPPAVVAGHAWEHAADPAVYPTHDVEVPAAGEGGDDGVQTTVVEWDPPPEIEPVWTTDQSAADVPPPTPSEDAAVAEYAVAHAGPAVVPGDVEDEAASATIERESVDGDVADAAAALEPQTVDDGWAAAEANVEPAPEALDGYDAQAAEPVEAGGIAPGVMVEPDAAGDVAEAEVETTYAVEEATGYADDPAPVAEMMELTEPDGRATADDVAAADEAVEAEVYELAPSEAPNMAFAVGPAEQSAAPGPAAPRSAAEAMSAEIDGGDDLETGEAEDEAAAGAQADAAAAVDEADVNHPSHAEAHDPLATTRRMSKQLRRARRAPSADGRAAVALHKEGIALLRQRRADEAVAVLSQLVALHPTSAKAHRDLGCAYLRADRLDAAAASLVRAIQLRPKFGDAFASLGDVYHLQGKVDDAAACYRRALSIRPSADKTHSNLLLTLNYHRKVEPRALFAEHLKWAQAHARPLAAEAAAGHDNDPSPERPIKVGYVSPDFRRHSVNFFIEPALANRDRRSVHVTCYSDAARTDDVTDRLANLCDDWRDVRGMSDEAVARLVREDRIDILVDLAGHTGTNRLCVFARKPAPVQVTYLGYPNTTGLDTIDYRITDNAADPLGQTEGLHTEQLVRLPSFLCYQPPAEAPPVAPPPGMTSAAMVASNTAGGGVRPPGRVTFGCFNVLSKVTPETLSLWAKIMTVLPESRLVMKDRLGTLANPARRRFVHDIFAYHRVAPERLELLGKEPSFAAHLSAYGKVDITLDPFPYNGTTTTCESLWMGVPVIALAGNRHAARVGVSILTAVGLTEFVANSPESYARAAVVLARDTTRLALLRRTLRQRMAASTLMDAKRFGANMDRVYRQMWQIWCSRQAAGEAGQTDTLSLRDE